MSPKRAILLIVLAIVGITAAQSLFVVKETEQVLVVSLGKIDREIRKPGLYIRAPFYQQVVNLDRRLLETDSPSEEIVSQDKKRLVVDSFTRWRIIQPKEFYESVRTYNSARSRLDSIVNSSLKEALAKETLQDIVSGERSNVMGDILLQARTKAKALGIEVVDVRIKRTDLPKANSDAVYKRMRAERDKEARQIRASGAEEADKIRADADKQVTIMLAEAQKQAETLRGKADADAIRIYAQAYNKDPAFYSLNRTLEAYRKSMKDEDTMMILDPSVEFLKTFKDIR